MKRKNDRSLGEVLSQLVDGSGMREKMDELDIRSWWDELAGSMIARHTTSLELRRGKLFVRVDSAPLRQELTYMRATLVELLNKRAGREVVKEVVLQ